MLLKEKLQEDNCAMCQYAMHYVYEFLENKDDQEEIRNVVETFCGYLPASVADKCENFVHNNMDKIIELVINNLTPDQICAALKMCASKKPVNV